jgi:hypothetical protein
VDAHISHILYLGLWLLLAGVVALGARWLGGASRPPALDEACADADSVDDAPDPQSPLIAWAGTAVGLTALLVLWARHDPEVLSAVVLLAVLATLLLHIARRGALPDRDPH